jgi:hypothetical protein
MTTRLEAGSAPGPARVLRRVWVRLPCRPLLRFAGLRRGFLDVRQGFFFCALMACCEPATSAKLYELDGGRPPVNGASRG